MDSSCCLILSKEMLSAPRQKHTLHYPQPLFSCFSLPSRCFSALMHITQPIYLSLTSALIQAVLNRVHAQMHFCVSVRWRSRSQVLYEFHLSAAWGTKWRISPNGLVCNCSVNTCLSRLGECGLVGRGGTAPHSDALKPLIEQPIAICFLTVAGGEGEPGPTSGLYPTSKSSRAASLL